MEKTIRDAMINEIVEEKIEHELTKMDIFQLAYQALTREISLLNDSDLQDEWDDTIGVIQ